MISVLIPAYNAQDYIDDCLRSIVTQAYFKKHDYEIIVGIDGCRATEDALYGIMEDYHRVRAIVIKKNVGKFITLNTLIEQAKGDIIVTFDADDIMASGFVGMGVSYLRDYDVVRFGNYNFHQRQDRIVGINAYPRDSVLMFKKSVLGIVGGYRPWRIFSDRDFIKRLEGKVKIKDITTPLYYKRLHIDSLFYDSQYGFNSVYGRACRKKIGGKEKVKPSTAAFREGLEDVEIEESAISVVIAAYRAKDYIEECLDSIEGQEFFKGNNNYEILIGIDGCQETKEEIQKIREKYRNLRVFANDSNYGAYATINSLMSEAKNDIILRFDADDVMKPKMVKRCLYYMQEQDVVMFGYESFEKKIGDMPQSKFVVAGGVFALRKELFERAGGFRAWECAADSEFIERVKRNSRAKTAKERLFYRRIHEDSLTKDINTTHGSKRRKEHKEKIRTYEQGEDIRIEMVKSNYKEI
jgi:glycosyltransferase involved in cell wall biosynthesis